MITKIFIKGGYAGFTRYDLPKVLDVLLKAGRRFTIKHETLCNIVEIY